MFLAVEERCACFIGARGPIIAWSKAALSLSAFALSAGARQVGIPTGTNTGTRSRKQNEAVSEPVKLNLFCLQLRTALLRKGRAAPVLCTPVSKQSLFRHTLPSCIRTLCHSRLLDVKCFLRVLGIKVNLQRLLTRLPREEKTSTNRPSASKPSPRQVEEGVHRLHASEQWQLTCWQRQT